MSTEKNDTRKSMGVVSAIPEFIGVMAGITVLSGKWIENHVRGLLGEKPRPQKPVVKTPVQIDAEKRIAAIEEKMTGKKRVKAKKKSAKKKKTVKKAKKMKKKTAKKTTKKRKAKG